MLDFLHKLFNTQQYMPHGLCYQWDPAVLWLHVISDAVIGLAYLSIPITLLYFRSKRSESQFSWVLTLFVVFILLCGFTHFVSIWTAWQPVYRFEGILKSLTALASIATALALIPVVPKILAQPSQEQLEKEIRERQRVEADLALTNKELQRSNRELSDFAAIASHDLQAPLRNIIGYCQLLERRYEDKLDQKGKEFLGFASSNAAIMQTLVKDLLALSKVGHSQLVPEPTDLNAVMQQTLTLLNTVITQAGADVLLPENLPVVNGSRGELVQLMQNLISNGIKFHSADKKPVITISAEASADEWRICVADNGIGIAPEYQTQIFAAFNRLHSTDDYPGSGIGLAVCEKVVTRHGGELWLESELGKGCKFYFTLPGYQGS